MTGYQPRYSPRYRVTVGDDEYTEAGGRVADLVVETTVDGADRFSFTLQYPFDEERGTFRGLSWESITAGTRVSIATGYGDSGSLTPLLGGRIDTVRATFDRSVGPTVVVEGFGRLRATMTGTASRSWRETDLATVVESVLDPYPFATLDVAAGVEREWLFQDNRSDYRFLAALAETYGFQFYASRDTVVFRPREGPAGSSDPVADLWYGDALREFEGEIRRQGETTAVEVRSWDPGRGEERVATAGPADADTTDVYRVPAMTRQETARIATERHSSLTDGTVAGHGVAEGTPALQAGVTVTLSELGDRFSGTYRVTEATHRMGESGYRTVFEAREVPA